MCTLRAAAAAAALAYGCYYVIISIAGLVATVKEPVNMKKKELDIENNTIQALRQGSNIVYTYMHVPLVVGTSAGPKVFVLRKARELRAEVPRGGDVPRAGFLAATLAKHFWALNNLRRAALLRKALAYFPWQMSRCWRDSHHVAGTRVCTMRQLYCRFISVLVL